MESARAASRCAFKACTEEGKQCITEKLTFLQRVTRTKKVHRYEVRGMREREREKEKERKRKRE
jgi:hypothetical protein